MMRPLLLLTFVLHDGTTRSKTCDVYEAIRQLAEAKSFPAKWKDFKIEPAPATGYRETTK